MENMSYCKFENTLMSLRECTETIYDVAQSETEEAARIKLIQLCMEIAREGGL